MSVEQEGSQSSIVEDIINTSSIIDLLKLVKERDDLRSLDSVQDRFRIACAENDLIEGYRQADWVDAFDKFLSGLKEISFSKLFSSKMNCRLDPRNFMGIDNQDLSYYLNSDRFMLDFPEDEPQHLKIHFTLIEPKVKDPRLPKKVEVLFRRTERLSPTEVEIWYELGNRLLISALPEEELISYNSLYEVTTILLHTSLYFDEECNLYFTRPDRGIDDIKIYQKDLRTNSEPVVIHTFEDIFCVTFVGVRGGKLYALIDVRTDPDVIRRIDCVDLATKKVLSVAAPEEIHDFFGSFPFENGIVFTNRHIHSYVYMIDEDKLVLKIIPSTLRTQLNRYSFVHQREILYTHQLKAFSFVDGKLVETHIGEIDQSTIILRHTDHVFAVLQKKCRYIYYEEKPGTKPILLHTDNRPTPMRNYGDRWIPKDYTPFYE